MNRLDALKYFTVAADTLNFRQTAEHFAVSPQVITRVIGELEGELGETLFRRNTRSIRLTDFGLAFLPHAEQLLKEEEKLFGLKKADDRSLAGMVRVTLPPSMHNPRIIKRLLDELTPYPDITIDWREGFELMKAVDDNIDIGLRICRAPQDDWVAKKIASLQESVVASPLLLERLGTPKDLNDLLENFPVGTNLDVRTGRAEHWVIDGETVPLHKPRLISSNPNTLLNAVLDGKIAAAILHRECAGYLANGELVALFPCHHSEWHYYLYRPYQTLTPARVLLVFELLEKVLKETAEDWGA